MTLMRRQPILPAFQSLQDEMNQLFRRFFEVPAGLGLSQLPEGAGWMPPINLEETDDNLVVTVEVPGMDPKDVEVSVHSGDLTISGKREAVRHEKKGTLQLEEISRGSFFRRISLPAEVTTEKSTADYKNGLLRVTLPKSGESKRRSIPVKAAPG